MSDKTTFSLFDASLPLVGRCLIEANAGTGKTYNITGIATRLIAENRFDAGTNLSNILIVTFTRAATKELKARMTERLHQCIGVLKSGAGSTTDDFLKQFASRYGNQPDVKTYLANALDSIDELSIFTIHGFCRRLLTRHAVKAGIHFNESALVQQNELMEEITADYWRVLNSRADDDILAATLLTHLREKYSNPKKLSGTYGIYIGDFTLSVRSLVDEEQLCNRLDTMQARFVQCRDELTDEILKELEDLYSGSYNLNAHEFKPEKWHDRYQIMRLMKKADYFFEGTPNQYDSLRYVGYEGISQKFTKNSSYDDLGLSEHTLGWMKAWDEFLLDIDWYSGLAADLDELAIHKLQCHYRQQAAEREEYSYNELLHLAHTMIAENSSIRDEIKNEYPAALIDEFQDTDPLQWELFNRLYKPSEDTISKNLLYLIGDPKQSIYKFRGADIYTYIHARESVPADKRFTLTTNYRSDRSLVRAINTLWQDKTAPFFNDAIAYNPSEAGHDDRSPLSGQLAPLTWITDTCAEEPDLNANKAKERAAHIAAQHIAQTLNQHSTNNSFDFDDIAVLCSTNREAALMKQVLRKYNLNSVLLNRDNIYESDEARELYIILKAVQEPGNQAKVRAALGTDLIGEKELLKNLMADQSPDSPHQRNWNRMLAEFRRWNEVWADEGIAGLMPTILSDCSGLEHLLNHPDGERRVTNIHHLGTLLEAMERDRPSEPRYQLQQFLTRIKQAKEGESSPEEEEELRLESDQNLVRLVTIHRSKGLKYPVVYCPFLWYGINVTNLLRNKPFVFHQSGGEKKVLVIDGNRYPDSIFSYFCELLEESLRVMYVAMTRAEHHALFIHVPYQANYKNARSKAYSPLDYMLLGRERFRKALSVSFNQIEDEQSTFISYKEVKVAVDKLAASSGGLIEHLQWPDNGVTPPMQPAGNAPGRQTSTLALQSFAHTDHLYRNWKIHSFSSLSGDHAAGDDYYLEAEAAKMDESWADEEHEPPAFRTPGEDTLFDFPKGKQTGLCWHAIFEHISFHQPETWQAITAQQLELHGFDTDRWLPVIMRCVEQTMNLLLQPVPDLRLKRFGPRDIRREMAFHFQLNRADFNAVMQIIRRPSTAPGVPSPGLRGFMNGFIDLTFEYGQKYYILDYKSNYLGNRFDDYTPEKLAEAIRRNHYDVQYHIYALALCRYLRRQMGTSFDYERHFGGVFYLYLRGIKGSSSKNGIHYHRPEEPTLQALETYFNATNP